MKEEGEQKEELTAEEEPIYWGKGPVLLVLHQHMDKIS